MRGPSVAQPEPVFHGGIYIYIYIYKYIHIYLYIYISIYIYIVKIAFIIAQKEIM